MFSLESQPLLEMSSFSVLPAKVNHDFNGTMRSLSPHGLRLSFQNLWLCPCSFLCLEAVVTSFLSMNSCEQSMHPLLQRMCLLLNALSNASTQNAHFQLRYTFIAMWIFLWGIGIYLNDFYLPMAIRWPLFFTHCHAYHRYSQKSLWIIEAMIRRQVLKLKYQHSNSCFLAC